MGKKFISIAAAAFLWGCATTLTIRSDRLPLGDAGGGNKWQMVKVATSLSGRDVPGFSCDETVFLKVDAKKVILDVKLDVSSPKQCFGEESVREALLGKALPAIIAGGSFMGGQALRRPSTTRIVGDTTSSSFNCEGDCSSDITQINNNE